ncbi:MAG: sigma-70 family RNA polymerase sigma factor [Blastocatellia bacterium]|nr:sigma-70 family RNA polymerase sigma factor [Blastocatellia bacterium]
MTEKRTINQAGFDRFLACLDTDRERAGHEYERIRGRLLLYFQCRDIVQAEDCADESINRVIQKLEAGEELRDPVQYVFGVARMVLLETTRRQARHQEVDEETLVSAPQPEDDEGLRPRLDCLRRCLQRLTPEKRELITQYYQEEKRAKINLRQQLAQRLGVDLNTLRVRACRLRDALQACVEKCVAEQGKM